MIRFYTYDEVADIFRVAKTTVKAWKATGKIEIYGYRPYKDVTGKRLREVVIEEKEVKRLAEDIFKRGSWYMQTDKRLRDKVVNNDVVNDKVEDKLIKKSVEVINESVDDPDKVNNQSSIDVVEDSDRDNSHVEGDVIIVNLEDNNPDKVNNK